MKQPRSNSSSFVSIVAKSFVPLSFFAAGMMASIAPSIAQDFTRDTPFASEMYHFMVEDEIRPPEPCKTLFVGSSSIRFWITIEEDLPEIESVTRGLGGSQMEHANLYFETLVARHKPARIFLYQGENDISVGDTPETVLSDLKVFMQKKTDALDDATVFFISIKPSPARLGQLESQDAANELVRSYSQTREDLVFVDVVGTMMNGREPKDIFVFDNVHMNRKGYTLWSSEVRKALNDTGVPTASYCQ